MDADAGEIGEDANRFGGRCAAFGMDGVVRQPAGAGDVRPGEAPSPTHARLVAMQDRRSPQGRFDLQLDRLQRCGRLPYPSHQRALRKLHLEEIAQQVTHTVVGHELLLHQIHRQRPQAVSILRSAGCLGGNASALTTPHTGHCLCSN